MTDMQTNKMPLPLHSGFDRKFIAWASAILVLVIIFSTYLHHFQPQVLRVPDNKNVSTWTNPKFEQTCIYERMTEAEKQKIYAEGIPDDKLTAVVTGDIAALLVSLLRIFHARKHYGDWMAFCFVVGSFIFTGIQESMWILFGRFTGLSAMQGLGEQVFGTYWFAKRGSLVF
jgi:hypothetical protein